MTIAMINNLGLRIGDQILISPIQGHKKRLKLNRKVYDILPSTSGKIEFKGSTIY